MECWVGVVCVCHCRHKILIEQTTLATLARAISSNGALASQWHCCKNTEKTLFADAQLVTALDCRICRGKKRTERLCALLPPFHVLALLGTQSSGKERSCASLLPCWRLLGDVAARSTFARDQSIKDSAHGSRMSFTPAFDCHHICRLHAVMNGLTIADMHSSTQELNELKRLVEEALSEKTALMTAKRNEQERENETAILHARRARLDAEILASEEAVQRARDERRRLEEKVEVSEPSSSCSFP